MSEQKNPAQQDGRGRRRPRGPQPCDDEEDRFARRQKAYVMENCPKGFTPGCWSRLQQIELDGHFGRYASTVRSRDRALERLRLDLKTVTESGLAQADEFQAERETYHARIAALEAEVAALRSQLATAPAVAFAGHGGMVMAAPQPMMTAPQMMMAAPPMVATVMAPAVMTGQAMVAPQWCRPGP